jgi:hypothetical protein
MWRVQWTEGKGWLTMNAAWWQMLTCCTLYIYLRLCMDYLLLTLDAKSINWALMWTERRTHASPEVDTRPGCTLSNGFLIPDTSFKSTVVKRKLFQFIQELLLCCTLFNGFFLSCNCVILSTNKGGQRNFIVIRSCRVTERNSIGITSDTSRMAPLKTIRKMLVSVIFRQFCSCLGLFDIAG